MKLSLNPRPQTDVLGIEDDVLITQSVLTLKVKVQVLKLAPSRARTHTHAASSALRQHCAPSLVSAS